MVSKSVTFKIYIKMKNLKTTLAGCVVIIAGGVLIYLGQSVEGAALMVVGVGLVSAKDHNVSGGTVLQ
jgi:hypothetical protein